MSRLTPLTPEQQALAADARHRRLAVCLADRFARRTVPHLRDEFRSVAMLGLVRAARRFDPARGLCFGTLARWCVRGELLDFARAQFPMGYRRNRHSGRPPATASLACPAGHPGRPCELSGLLAAGGEAVGWEEESLDAVRALLRPLHWRQRLALELYLTRADTPTPARVGAAMGVSRSRASQLIIEGLAELRRLHGVTAGEAVGA